MPRAPTERKERRALTVAASKKHDFGLSPYGVRTYSGRWNNRNGVKSVNYLRKSASGPSIRRFNSCLSSFGLSLLEFRSERLAGNVRMDEKGTYEKDTQCEVAFGFSPSGHCERQMHVLAFG